MKLPYVSFQAPRDAAFTANYVAEVLTSLAGQQEFYDEGWMLALFTIASTLKLRVVSERNIGAQP